MIISEYAHRRSRGHSPTGETNLQCSSASFQKIVPVLSGPYLRYVNILTHVAYLLLCSPQAATASLFKWLALDLLFLLRSHAAPELKIPDQTKLQYFQVGIVDCTGHRLALMKAVGNPGVWSSALSEGGLSKHWLTSYSSRYSRLNVFHF